MNKTLVLLLLSAMLMHAQWAHGQQNVRIIGKVVGPNDWSLSNAHVVDVLLGEGVTTDNYGVFHINIADTGTVLRVSHVGYHPLLTSITPDMIAAKEGGRGEAHPEDDQGSPPCWIWSMSRHRITAC
jgi:hypothetical protein